MTDDIFSSITGPSVTEQAKAQMLQALNGMAGALAFALVTADRPGGAELREQLVDLWRTVTLASQRASAEKMRETYGPLGAALLGDVDESLAEVEAAVDEVADQFRDALATLVAEHSAPRDTP